MSQSEPSRPVRDPKKVKTKLFAHRDLCFPSCLSVLAGCHLNLNLRLFLLRSVSPAVVVINMVADWLLRRLYNWGTESTNEVFFHSKSLNILILWLKVVPLWVEIHSWKMFPFFHVVCPSKSAWLILFLDVVDTLGITAVWHVLLNFHGYVFIEERFGEGDVKALLPKQLAWH